ncbi:MAG: hypothetical protein IID43_03905 [Planctomycetes bacterium]|nr:hypothetical protein [Planctomycetota bacterium]
MSNVNAGRRLRETELLLIAVLLCFVAVGSGCQHHVNPFVDVPGDREAITTASVDIARAFGGQRTVLRRDTAVTQLTAVDGTVTHGPLYFEDPFEDQGSEDGRFAWTAEDVVQPIAWWGRFLLNAVSFPVSVVVTPPWVVMASDGYAASEGRGRRILGFRHDAERWSPPPRTGRANETLE